MMSKIIRLMEIICLISVISACSDDPPTAPEGASSDWDNRTKVEGTKVTYTCITGEVVKAACDAISLTWNPSTILCPDADPDDKRRKNLRKIKKGKKMKKEKNSGKKGKKRTGRKHGRKSGKKHGGKKTQSPVTTEVPASFDQTKPNQTCTCGVKNTKTPRIVGGQEAQNFEWPWMVRLREETKGFICGGSLIADQWILSVAHCFVHCTDENVCTDKHSQVIVSLGDHEVNAVNTNEKLLIVIKIINHARYNKKSGYHDDISLLKLRSKVDLNKYTPVCLPDLETTYVGKMVDVYGWGSTSYLGQDSPILLETRIEIVPPKVCANEFDNLNKTWIFTDKQICAFTEGTDTCQGDSGGPMTYDDNGKHKQIGIVSYGKDCGKYPGVYTRVTAYLGWIKKNIKANGGAVYCNK